jgi:aminomethyltransferase
MMRPMPRFRADASRAHATMNLQGWTYPAEWSGAVEEYQAVRTAAGIFDFSFLAHLVLRGSDAPPLLQRVVTSDVARLAAGTALYSSICSETGTFVDDIPGPAAMSPLLFYDPSRAPVSASGDLGRSPASPLPR